VSANWRRSRCCWSAAAGCWWSRAGRVSARSDQERGPRPRRLRGRAFPDAHIDVHALHITGDVAVEEGTFTGTHDGALHSPAGDIPPTGRPVAVDYVHVLHIRGGKHVSFNLMYDRLLMLEQLDLLQPQHLQAEPLTAVIRAHRIEAAKSRICPSTHDRYRQDVRHERKAQAQAHDCGHPADGAG
jgi:ketosteroid isomerase-like protein